MDQERLLKRVWLVNGLLLAVLFVALAIWLVVELGSSWFHRHSAVIPATHGAPVSVAINPQTNTIYVAGDLYNTLSVLTW